MSFKSSGVNRALVLLAVATAVALGHACTEDPAGPGSGTVAAPQNVTLEVTAYNRIRLQWAAAAGATGYVVERRQDLTGSFSELGQSSSTSYLDNAVAPETFYGYRVRSLAGANTRSEPSEVVGARTPREPGIEVTITMNAPDPASADNNGFRLRVSGPQNVMESVTANATALVTPLAAGTYTVTLEDVAATCAVEAGPSRTVTVTALGTQTVAPISFTVRCRDSTKGGIVVALTAAGDTSDDNGVIARVVGTAAGASSVQDTLMVRSGQTALTQKLELLTLAPGSYEISLLDINTSMCSLAGSPNVTRSVVAARNDTVRFNLTCSKNRAPVAEANGPYSGMVNSSITFNAAGSTDPDGTIASYSWNFGDGSNGTGASVTHAYATPGSYRVRLTVTDNAGATSSDSADVTVVPGFAWKNRFSDDSLPAGEVLFLDVTSKPGPAVTGAEARISYNPAGLRLDSIEGAPHWTSFTRNGTVPGTAVFQAATTSPSDATQETPVATLHFTVIGAPGTVLRTTTRNIALRNGDGAAISIGAMAVIEDTARISAGGNRPPVAKVNVLPSSNVQTRDTLAFTSQPGTFDPDGSVISYSWNFGDGTVAGTSIVRKKYDVPGNYTVKLTVMDNAGATASDSMVVTVTQVPNVAPTADAGGPYTGVVGSAVRLSAVKSKDTDGNLVRYDWQFGDGTSASTADSVVFRTYNAVGSYIVGLTVFDNRGGIASDTARVTITSQGSNRPPVAEANGPYSGIVGQPVALRATGTTDPDANIKSYTWHYPDQTTTTGFNTLKTFSTAGLHSVTLVVTDSLDLVATDITTVIVSAAGQTNQPPVAEANGPYTTRRNLPLAFSSVGTRDPDGMVVSYRWNFGDGTSTTDTTLASPTHVYDTTGTFTVSLLVTDNRGASAVDVTAVTVLPGIAPVAHAGGPYTGVSGTAINFSGAISVDADGTIVSYDWDFGDGSAGTGVTTSHTYAAPGLYRVRLTVADDHGFTNRDSSTVTVTGPPVNAPPAAKANGPYTGVADVAIGFSAAGSQDADGSITSYVWSFGDGGMGTGLSTTHTYTSAGQYMVVLTVTDNGGATDADTAQVTVSSAPSNNPPVAKANGPYNGNVGSPISFTANGSSDTDGNIVTYSWDFGDGGTALAANVTHTYSSGGTFVVKLTVTDNLGATATDSAMVTVSGASSNQKPVAEAGGPYTGNAGSALTFSSAGSQDPDGTIASYSWTFGDGQTGTGTSPTHTYATAGSYQVILTVTDNLGAADADTAQVTVNPAGTNTPPVANPGGPYNGVVGTAITLNGSGTDNGSITAYAWDLDNDGAFDDAAVASPQFTCSAAGTVTIGLQVTDNGTPPLTGSASTTVNCTTTPGPTVTTVRGRWVNASGATITSATTGSTIFLELDIQLAGSHNIGEWQAVLQWGAGRLTATTQGADLNCSNPGGQASCPSGTPPAGNTDVMAQYIGNSATPNQLTFLNGSFSGDGVGIQGLARLQFTAGSAGALSPTLVIQTAAGNGGALNLLPLTTQIPPITIN